MLQVVKMDALQTSDDEHASLDLVVEWQGIADQLHAEMLVETPPASPVEYLRQLCENHFGGAFESVIVDIIGACFCKRPVTDAHVQSYLKTHWKALNYLVLLAHKENYAMIAGAELRALPFSTAVDVMFRNSLTVSHLGRKPFKATTIKLRIYPPKVGRLAGPVEVHVLHPSGDDQRALPLLLNGIFRPLDWLRRLGSFVGSAEYAQVDKFGVVPARHQWQNAAGVNLNMPWSAIYSVLEIIEPHDFCHYVTIRATWKDAEVF